MLTEHKKNKATEIARLLVREGMVFGQDLYKFVKAEEAYGVINFKSEQEIDLFMDFILDYVERSWNKVLVVHDTKENITKHFTNVSQAARYLSTTQQNIRYSKCVKTKIKNRYIVDSYNPKISDLYEGMDNMESRWNI